MHPTILVKLPKVCLWHSSSSLSRLVPIRGEVPLSHLLVWAPHSSPLSPSSAPRDSPAVGQVECNAGLDVCPKAQVAQDTQADVQDGDNAHPHVEDDWELPGLLHLVFQRQHLGEEEEEDDRAASCLFLYIPQPQIAEGAAPWPGRARHAKGWDNPTWSLENPAKKKKKKTILDI